MATKFVTVFVSKGCVKRWLKPIIVAINSNKSLEFISIVYLFK